jgi:hypothetical protein
MRNLTAVLALIPALVACRPAPAPAPEPAVAESVESAAAGVRVAALPEGVRVAANDAGGLRLTVASENGDGTMTVTSSDVYATGLNIIDAVEAEMAAFEARPEGRSFGQTKMVAPIGLTYMARGRYLAEGAEVEELRALLAHPWGNRLLTLSYVYPAGTDTSERGALLMEVLGEMEALDQASVAPGD